MLACVNYKNVAELSQPRLHTHSGFLGDVTFYKQDVDICVHAFLSYRFQTQATCKLLGVTKKKEISRWWCYVDLDSISYMRVDPKQNYRRS